jgi:hypothetical protein
MPHAVKLQVTIPEDWLVQLPDDLPEGRAEIIVLYPETTAGDRRASRAVTGARSEPALRPHAKASSVESPRSTRPSYFARLVARQPVPLSTQASRALDEADRGER